MKKRIFEEKSQVMTISIKRASEEDLPILFEMIKEFADYLGKQEKVKISLEDLRKGMPHFQFFIIEKEEKEIAGYAFTFFSFHTWAGKNLYLDDLYIREKYRRQSIGNQAIEFLKQFGKDNGCTCLQWQVLDWNERAIKFYQKIGASIGDDNLNCEIALE
ncbi:MAG: GNAT family N-acetyltransferase [Flavobacteriaceae bacterium]|nr:GNAT family N-acetyltransferase [Flavobacteriaceae bacterium]